MRKGAKIKLAKQFRRQMTHAEVKLWIGLRGHTREGFAIRRQHPVGPFVLDFYCDRVKLAFEVDGEIHTRGDHPERDARRDQWLLDEGIETIRISGRDIMADVDEVVIGLIAMIKGRMKDVPER